MNTAPKTAVRPRRRWLRRLLVIVPTLGVLGIVAVFAAIYLGSTVPLPEDAPEPQTAIVYFADGTTEIGRLEGEENRIEVPIETVPQHVKDAVLAAEDRGYYEHEGLSFTSLIRAAWQSVVPGGATQGGSTITQQYAKNAFLSSERTFTRKFREASIALKLEREYSKDEILGFYLNTIYFGRGAYGIESAAQAYFGVPASQLSPAQGIVLANLIRSPEGGAPDKVPDVALRRFEATRDAMVELGTLNDPALGFPEILPRKPPAGVSGPNGYLLSLVRDDLEAHGVPAADVNNLGLRIVTTIDQRAQDAAVAAVNEVLDDPANDPQAALVSIDPATGAVRALYGGRDYAVNQFNYATQGLRQPGSSFKPYALAAALQEGVSLKTTFDGTSPREFPGYDKPVSNFGDQSFGQVDLVKATASSVNTVYVDLALQLGPDRVADAAYRAGIPLEGVRNGLQTPTELRPDGSLVLGTSEVHVIDQAVAYSTFAAQGVRHQPFLVLSAAASDGREVYRNQVVGEEVLDPAVAADLTYALTQVVEQGSGEGAKVDGHPTAGKTGTTQESRDAWFVGYTPKLATAVWMGYDPKAEGDKAFLEDVQGISSVTGGSLPADIFKLYMDVALEGVEPGAFPEPAFIGESDAPPPAPTSAPTPSESATPTPSPSVTVTEVPIPTQAPTATQAPTPTTTRPPRPAPTPTPTTPEPTPTAEPTPAPEPTAEAEAGAAGAEPSPSPVG